MALEAHLEELQSKHRNLEKQLEEALARPATNDIQISKLKREKLRLKDELVRLQNGR